MPSATVKKREPQKKKQKKKEEYAFSTMGSLLKFFGTWEGDDAEKVKEIAKAHRLKAKF